LTAVPLLQSRANGIDRLHKALLDVRSGTVLLPELPQFVAFLRSLVQDPNFKIALSSLNILGELVSKVGLDIEPHVRCAAGGLATLHGVHGVPRVYSRHTLACWKLSACRQRHTRMHAPRARRA
jgi:hypothetical protein